MAATHYTRRRRAPGPTGASRRDELDAVAHPMRLDDLSDQSKVANRLPDGYAKRMPVHQAGERSTRTQPTIRDAQQVVVVRKENPPGLRRPFEQRLVVEQRAAVLVRGKAIHAAREARR